MTDRVLRLYHYPFSPPSEAVRIVLDEKALPYTIEMVDLATGTQRTSNFLRMNYRAQVPVLVDGHFHLTESNVIAEYLEGAFPDATPLLPSCPQTRARIRQWIAILQLDWHSLRQAIYHEGILKPLKLLPGPGDRRALRAARAALIPHLEALEEQLQLSAGEGPYLVGVYSLADALFTPTLYILDRADILPRHFVHIRAWSQACLARPSGPKWLHGQGMR